MDEARLLSLLRLLLVPGMHATAATRLLKGFDDDPARVLRAHHGALAAVRGVGPALAAAVRQACPSLEDARTERSRACDLGLTLLGPADAAYPKPLRHAWDPPALLYVRGGWIERDVAAVAIVGARRCTPYGRTQARRLGRELAATGLAVVSGLARGVDTAAHEGALESGRGRTVAVMGSGLARPYPAENRDLLRRVAERGAVVSAFPLDAPPLPHHFPQRNRILASLALGTVVIEAGARSGSLITARLALEAGRDVMVVPGPVDDPLSLGGHRLLRDGAAPVRSAAEIREVLGFEDEAPPNDGQLAAAPDAVTPGAAAPDAIVCDDSLPAGDAGVVLRAITARARDANGLVVETGLDVMRIRSALVDLELDGRVRAFPGGYWGRT